jgi:hypothetical protein
MRTTLPAALLALALLAPGAAAAPNAQISIAILTPVEEMSAGQTQPLTFEVTLELREFACFEAATFPVQLTSSSKGGLNLSFESETLQFDVPEGSYLAQPYRGTATTNATLVADGGPGSAEVLVVARFAHAGDPCVAPGGFHPTSGTYTITMMVQEAEPEGTDTSAAGSGDAANGTVDGNTTVDGNSTLDGNANGTLDGNSTGEPQESTGPGTMPPGSGYIGEYDPEAPAGGDGGNAIPASGVVLALAATLAALAVLRPGRRRNR